MKVELLPSGSYRVRKTYKGQTYNLTFPYKPSQKEAMQKILELIENGVNDRYTMKYYIEKYIDSKRNVLSPSSVRTYEQYINVLSAHFLNLRLADITQFDVQTEINRYAENHAPKTVKTMRGFISSVIGSFRPNLSLRVTVPQEIQKSRYLPSQDDIRAILDYAKGTEDSVGFQLGVLSLRRSEVCALEMSDLDGNKLHVHANMVFNKGWIKKESPKTDAGNRIIYLPDSLVDEIQEQGYFFKYSPNKLLEHLHKVQKALGLPQFRFHDLRHFFASYSSTIMSEAEAMSLGGWKSDYIFKRIYRDTFEDKKKESAEKLNNSLFGKP